MHSALCHTFVVSHSLTFTFDVCTLIHFQWSHVNVIHIGNYGKVFVGCSNKF